MFSSYKNRNTIKVLVAIMPSGVVTFISPTFMALSEKKKFNEICGLLDLLETGDIIYVDIV